MEVSKTNQKNEHRLFVAIRLPQHLKDQLGQWIKSQQSRWAFQKWIHLQDIHVTLHFLGGTSDAKQKEVMSVLDQQVQNQYPFSLSLDGIGVFGIKTQPHILWAGVGGEIQNLHLFQKKVTNSLESIGFPSENRPYYPHVTLARKHKDNTFLLPVNENYWGKMDKTWMVKDIVLYRSVLGKEPMYHEVAVFPFSLN
jgi:2'-5' RNA ligase